MIKVTTSLRKIAGMKKRIRAVRGGQGSAKTISILAILINHASSKSNKEIIICSAELTKMRLTVIKDFVKVMRWYGIYEERNFKAGTLYRFPNGSFIKFIGLDKEDVGKGLRSDVVYFNEVNKIDRESYRQLSSRAGQIFLDYNPDAEFFIDEDVIPRDDCQLLQLTFEDNEYLPESEREEILNYYRMGYFEDGSIKNKYWANLWQVYGLGNIGSIHGVIFPNWEFKEIPPEARLVCTGVDFGFSVSKFAAVNVWYCDGDIYLDELVYRNDLDNPEAAEEMHKAGYVRGTKAYCDYAEPKSIKELKKHGIKAMPCDSKIDVKNFAIKKLNAQTFYVTKKSTNLAHELRHLIWDERTGKPKKTDNDHLTDAVMYAIGSDGIKPKRYFAI